MEADVANGVEDTEILMASYKDNFLKVNTGYLIQVVRFIYVPRKSCSITLWLQGRKEFQDGGWLGL